MLLVPNDVGVIFQFIIKSIFYNLIIFFELFLLFTVFQNSLKQNLFFIIIKIM